MIRSFLFFLFIGCLTHGLNAQNYQPVVKEKMAPLYRLAGAWQGEGWIVLQNGQRATFLVNEQAETKLGGTLLVVQGVGVRTETPTDTVHYAYGVLTYTPWTQTYNVRAYKSEGVYIDAVASFLDNGDFQWQMEAKYIGIIKNTIHLTDDGQWIETGQQSRDEGKTWTTFFEMQLKRVDQ